MVQSDTQPVSRAKMFLNSSPTTYPLLLRLRAGGWLRLGTVTFRKRGIIVATSESRGRSWCSRRAWHEDKNMMCYGSICWCESNLKEPMCVLSLKDACLGLIGRRSYNAPSIQRVDPTTKIDPHLISEREKDRERTLRSENSQCEK